MVLPVIVCVLPSALVTLTFLVAPSAGGLDLRPADDVIDLVLLEQVLDAVGHLVRDAAAALHHLGEIEADLTLDRQAVVLDVTEELLVLGALEQRLGRDAAPVEAGAAGAFHLDAHHFFPELGRADRSDITRRAATDDNEIVVHKAKQRSTGFVPENRGTLTELPNSPN